jgi:hypothetical protein
MGTEPLFLALDHFKKPPVLSLTTIRWVEETETQDDDGCTEVEEAPMFAVVGEQYKLQAVQAAADAIVKEGAFLPPRFWLVCENDNSYDSNAVAVHATVSQRVFNVGFLPRPQAVLFRNGMAALGKPEGTLEVLGCFTQGRSSLHPNGQIYLPEKFADLVKSGYCSDPANNPVWLSDPSPVAPRPYQGWHARGFSDDELRKIYCWYARKKKWRCFPGACDSAAGGFRSNRGRVAEEMDSFVLEPEGSPETAQLNDERPAKAFARQHLKKMLMEEMSEDEAEAVLKNTDLSGRLHGWEGATYWVSCHKKKPKTSFWCTLMVSRVGPGENDFKVDSIRYEPD